MPFLYVYPPDSWAVMPPVVSVPSPVSVSHGLPSPLLSGLASLLLLKEQQQILITCSVDQMRQHLDLPNFTV